MHLEVDGPEASRVFSLERTCQANEMHAHTYNHVIRVLNGSVRVFMGHGDSLCDYQGGQEVNIDAGGEHRVKALEDGTRYACVFLHRDFDGAVIQEYNGHLGAYA